MVTRGGHSQRLWFRTYRQRIVDGLEVCRQCRRPDDPRNWLTFDHLVPLSHGRALSFDNATILCEDCQVDKADKIWPHLISLAEEERRAPRDQRWFFLADIAAFRASAGNYCRRGVDGAQITIVTGDQHGIRCIACPLTLGGAGHVGIGDDFARAIDHVWAHRAAGHHVPDWVLEDLTAAARDVAPTPEAATP